MAARPQLILVPEWTLRFGLLLDERVLAFA